LIAPGLSLTAVAVVSILNPFFEEIFVTGYLITSLRERHKPSFAVATSAALRVSYHLYEGALGVVMVLPMGLVFALCFARYGRLWPLVIAHAIFDFIALASYIGR
jgi:membrane protease YdiL (CAAX protease family)